MANRFNVPNLMSFKQRAKSAEFNQNWAYSVAGLNELDTFCYGAVAPTGNLATGKVWLDSSVTPPVFRRYDLDDDEWYWVGIFLGEEAPGNPATGAVFVDSVTGVPKFFDGSEWIDIAVNLDLGTW